MLGDLWTEESNALSPWKIAVKQLNPYLLLLEIKCQTAVLTDAVVGKMLIPNERASQSCSRSA